MERTITKEAMINYLQSMLTMAINEKERFGYDERTQALFDNALACRCMVETLIGEPINLGKDGKVTVGF